MTVQQKLEAGRAGMNSESYRALMRHQAGAVTVIASGADGSRAGLTATAVCSLPTTRRRSSSACSAGPAPTT